MGGINNTFSQPGQQQGILKPPQNNGFMSTLGNIGSQFVSGLSSIFNPADTRSPINQAIQFGTRNFPKPGTALASTGNVSGGLPIAKMTGPSSFNSGSGNPNPNSNPYSFANYYAAHPEAKPGYVDPNASGNTGNTGGTFVGGPQYGGLTEEQKKNVVNPGSNTQGAATYRDASGAVVLNPNGTNYQNQSVAPGGTNPPPQFTINGLFPNVTSSLANLAGTQSPQYQNAQNLSQNAIQQLEALKAGAATDPFAGGRTDAAAYSGYQGALANARSQAEQALAGEVQGLQQTAQTATGQQSTQQAGLGAAGGLAQRQAVPYSARYIDPLTGLPVGGTGGAGSPQDAAALYASRVMSGKMTYDAAVSALSSYGPIGQQELTKALGPDFSSVQSNINAAIQGQLGPAAQNAAAQLQNLQTTLESSPGLIATGSPAINSLMQLISATSGVGAGSTQGLQSALTDARAAVANALGVANNSTPSTYDAYVKTLLPDGVTKDQLSNAIAQFNQQMTGKIGAYATPGATNYNPSQTNPSSNAFQEGQTSSDGSLIFKNGKWVKA